MTFAPKSRIPVQHKVDSSLDFLSRQCACGAKTSGSGTCSACQSQEEDQSSVLRRSSISSGGTAFSTVPSVIPNVLQRTARPDIQRKLTVNQPGDRFELEADRVADQVMRMPDANRSSEYSNQQVRSAGHQDPTSILLFRQTAPATSQPRVPTHHLEPIQPNSTHQLSNAIVAEFRAAAAAVNALTGLDISANVGDATRPIGFHTTKAGASNFTWHKTGRAIDLPQQLPWVVIEDPVSQNEMRFRLFLPMSAQTQPPQSNAGAAAAKLGTARITPHHFTRRPKSTDILLDGHQVAINGGFPGNKIFHSPYVDVTSILTTHGFARIDAQPGWQSKPTKQEWWHYERRDGLNYYSALQELYTDSDINAGFKNVLSSMSANKRRTAARLNSEGFPAASVNIIIPPQPAPTTRPRHRQVQRSGDVQGPTNAPPIVESVVHSSGQPLDTGVRSFMEHRFGRDFSRVRVHTDQNAAESASSVRARAYTVGNHVVFGRGEHPDRDLRLLAHELTHTLQQTRSDLRIQRWDSPEHVKIGEASTPGLALILLDSHTRDLPNRLDPPDQWPERMKQLYAKGSSIQQRFLKQGLTYGELVALSGDFYETFDHLNAAPLEEVYQLLPLIREKATTKELETATGGRYLTLAKRNETHFSQGSAMPNMKRWRIMHSQAIAIAKSGNANKAYAMNAAADHFLTDRFASGHLLTARNSNREGIGLLARQLASEPELQSLSAKIDHDIDNQFGVAVENAKGQRWTTYGDEMWNSDLNAENRKMVINATKASVNDVKEALAQRENYPNPTESTVFEAELLIPKLESAKQIQKHDESARQKVYDKLSKENNLRELVSSKFFGSADLVRQWVNRTDNEGLAAQPMNEKIRIINELLAGITDGDANFNAFTRVFLSASQSEQLVLRKVAVSAGSLRVNIWLTLQK